MQVAFAGLDGEILFERTGVVAVIAQFACGLYEERGVGTHCDSEIGRTLMASRWAMSSASVAVGSGMLPDGSTPLPERE